MKRSYSPSPPSSPVFTKTRRTSTTADVSGSRRHILTTAETTDLLKVGTLNEREEGIENLTPQSPSSSSGASFPCAQRQPSGRISSLSKQLSGGTGGETSDGIDEIESDNSQIKFAQDSLDIAEALTPDMDELELLSQIVTEPDLVSNQTVVNKPQDDTSLEFIPASTLLDNIPPPLSVGCPLLDLALAGGLRRGGVTEVVGESSAGKTQFCLQCALTTASKGEKVVYIVTEGNFPQARLDQMVEARGREDLRDLVLVQQVKDVHHLLAVLGDQLDKVAKEVAMVIVDSAAAVIRYDGDFTTGLLKGEIVHKLGRAVLGVALRHNMAVLVVNQVTANMEGSRANCFTWGRKVVASLGLAWTQYPHTRLWLTKTRLVVGKTASALLSGLQAETRLRTMHVDWSCRLETSTTHFLVDTKGCRGVRVLDSKSDK